LVGVLAAGAVGFAAISPGPAQAAPLPTASTVAPPSGAVQPSRPLCTPTVFGQAQQLVEAQLSGRVTQLNTLLGAVDDPSNQLTSADRQTLQTDISTVESPGIQGLQTTVQGATLCAQLLADAHSMVFSYRVYLVMTPQTHLTMVADRETYVEGLFVGLEPTVASAIESAQSRGKNVTAAQAAYNDLQAQVTAAQSATDGLSTQILAQTPEGYPGNWQVFLAARTSTTNARNDLQTADNDASQIRQDLG
jgi:hypothetical protein